MAAPAAGAAAAPRGQKCANPSCVTAHEKGTPMWRKGWETADGGHAELCNPCGILFKRGWYCPWCHAVHRPRADGAPTTVHWLPCDFCDAWVHLECEQARAPDTLQGETYACPTCRALPSGELPAARGPLTAPPASGQHAAQEARLGRRVAFSRPFLHREAAKPREGTPREESAPKTAPLPDALPLKRRRVAPVAWNAAMETAAAAAAAAAPAAARPPPPKRSRPAAAAAAATPRATRRAAPAATPSPPNALQLLVSASVTMVPSPDPPPGGTAPAAPPVAASPAPEAVRVPRAARWGGASKRRAKAAPSDADEAADARDMAAFETPVASKPAAAARRSPDALVAELRTLATTLRETAASSAAAAAGGASSGELGPSPPAVVHRLRLVLHYMRHMDATAAALRASGAAMHVAPLVLHADQFVASAARELCAQAPWADAVAELRAAEARAAPQPKPKPAGAGPACAKCRNRALSCSCRGRGRARRAPAQQEQPERPALLPAPPHAPPHGDADVYGCDDAFREGLRRISGEHDAAEAEAHARSWEATDASLAGMLSLPPGALLCLPNMASPTASGLLVEAPVLLPPPPSPLSRLLMSEGVPPSCRHPFAPFGVSAAAMGATPRLVLPPGGAPSPTAAQWWSLAPQSPSFAALLPEVEPPVEATQQPR